MASGYIYSWTGKLSSAYGKAGNWFNNTAGATATAVPSTSDEALVVAAGSITGPGAAFELGLTGTGAGLSVGGTLYGSYAFVGGTVTLASGAGLASPNMIDIGDNTAATIASKVATVLTVGSGSFLTATLATANTFDVLVGQGAGAHGTLAVNGTGIASAGTSGFWVGNGGNGVISLSGGGQVDSGTAVGSATRQIDLALGSNGGTGTMIVNGTNSFANFTNTVEVGFGGTGVISVSGGAFLDAGEGLNSLNIGDVYNGAIGSGIVNISASTAYLAGLVEVGAYGQGSLNVSNGATVDAYFYLPGTPPVWSALIGANAGSSGTLSLSGNSTMLASEGVAVGSSGTGVLNVSASTLSIYAPASTTTVALDAGVVSGAVGSVTVSGGLIYDAGAAGMIIGGGGSGSLAITSLGTSAGYVLTGNHVSGVALTVGANAGSTGNISVSGGGSALEVSGEVNDGANGQGSISVGADALLVSGTSGTSTGLVLGGVGGRGTLSDSGTGAQVVVTGQINVGEYGYGLISVTDGSGFTGQASGVPALTLGVAAGSSGSLLESDASSYVVLTGGVSVGAAGSGTLTAQNHAYFEIDGSATATVPGLVIGSGSGSSGTATIASQAYLLMTGAGITVGADGSGVLAVNTGFIAINAATAVGASALNVGVNTGSSGTVSVSGGLINDIQYAGMIVGDAGNGALLISQSGTQGGRVQTGDPTGSAGLAVGVAAGSSGNVSVSGSASGLGVNGTTSIGNNGVGNLSLTDGGHFDGGSYITNTGANTVGLVLGGVGGTGTMSLSEGVIATVVGQTIIGQSGVGAEAVTGASSFTGTASGVPAMVIGASSTGTGSLLLSDASYVALTGGLVVGSSGFGFAAVQNDAALAVFGSTSQSLPGLIIGQNGGGTGDLSISAGGNVVSYTGVAVGQFGSGELDVASATLTVSTSPTLEVPAIDAGVSVGSTGVMNVNGGLIDDTQLAGMVIGDLGTGTLSISQAGTVGGLVLTGDPASSFGLLLGNGVGSSGRVSISGSASGLLTDGTAVIGKSGQGSLSLTNGGRFEVSLGAANTGLVLGEAGGSGAMSEARAAQAYVIGQTIIGEIGSGTLSVTGGSSFTGTASAMPAMVVGGSSTGTGSVLVSGTNSHMSLIGGLSVGNAGTGSFTVSGGAVADNNGSTLTVGSHGTVLASGAQSTLYAGAATNFGTMTANGGTLVFLGAVSGAGSLAIGGNGLLLLDSTETNAVAFGSGGGILAAFNTADIGGVVGGWSAGDFIDLKGITSTSETFAAGRLSLFGAGSQLLGTVAFSGALTSSNFTLTALAGGGTAIGYHS